ncbi:hypothetical protein ABBQ32_013505 [Trebouxia sp. C0010 RCD-2024]
MLLLQHGKPCFLTLHKERLPLRRGTNCNTRTRAAQQDENKQQDVSQSRSSWDDHLNIQSKQADSYRPPMYQSQEIKASGEKFLGRLAVLILGAVLLGERITGNGAVQQLEISATGVPLWEIEPVLGIVVLALCVSAVWPSTVKVEEGKPKPGFLERIQNVSGRFACLGLASTITAEVVTGKGTLTLLNVETGLDTVSELEAIGAFVVMLLLTEDLNKDKKK